MVLVNGELCSIHIKTHLEFPLCPSATCELDFLEYSFPLLSE